MEDKKITEENLKRFEELLEKLERISDEKQQHHHEERLHEGPHHKKPHPPVPLHERRDLKIDFISNKELIEVIFGDEDTAKAVIDIITTSPTEIQIVLKVVLDLYNKVNSLKGE